MKKPLKFILALAIAATAVPAQVRAEIELDIPGLQSTSLQGDALVWEDATFYLEPWDNGLSMKLSNIGRRLDEVGRAIPIRIVDASMKRFVEIALPNRLDCAWRRWQPEKRIDALRLFVKREDLAPVLTKPFAMKASDGTEVKLQVGMPVAPTASGTYSVAARGDKMRLPIPHASVGWTYTATKVTEPEIPGTGPKVYRLDRNIPVRLLGEDMTPRAFWMSPEPARINDQALLRWATRCVELTVMAPNASVRPMDRPRVPPSPVRPVDVPLRPTGYYIPPGAPLATATGREVGVAAIPIPVSAPSGETSCFDGNLSATKIDDTTYPAVLSRPFRVCAPARLVERDP